MARIPAKHRCEGTRRWDWTYPSGYTTHGYDLDGACVPGVTTINGVLSKDGLPYFYGKSTAVESLDATEHLLMGRDEAIKWLAQAGNRKKEKAALLGTRLHVYADLLERTGKAPRDLDPEVVPFVESLASFQIEWKPTVVLSEFVVGSRAHRYMGTADQIVDIPGVGRLLIDLKTGGDAPGKVYPEFGLQLAALRYAEFRLESFEGAEQPVLEVDGCAIVHIRPDFYEVVPYDVTVDDFEGFVACRRIYGWRDTHEKVRPAWSNPDLQGALL